MPPSATDANGMARVTYTAGDGAGLTTLTAASGDKASGVAISGSRFRRSRHGSACSRHGRSAHHDGCLGCLITSTQIGRQGGAGLAVKPTPVQQAVATRLEIVADPSTAVAGGSVVLRMSARDARGVGLTGQTLTVQTSAGQVSAVTTWKEAARSNADHPSGCDRSRATAASTRGRRRGRLPAGASGPERHGRMGRR